MSAITPDQYNDFGNTSYSKSVYVHMIYGVDIIRHMLNQLPL